MKPTHEAMVRANSHLTAKQIQDLMWKEWLIVVPLGEIQKIKDSK